MLDPASDRPTVSSQANDENSVLSELKKLIKIRKSICALSESADFEPVCVKGYPLVYMRKNENICVLVAINPSDKEVFVEFNGKPKEVIYQYNGAANIENGTLTVPPCSASYISLKR